MGIIGILMSMGFAAFIQFRKARQVDTIAYTARDMIKDARGKAMSVATTSTTATGVWPIGYSVVIDSNHVQAQIIYDPGNRTTYVPWEGVEGASEILGVVEMSPVEVDLTQCNKVVFESVNGTMRIYNAGGLEVNACTIEFELLGYSRQLQLNASTKQFEVI